MRKALCTIAAACALAMPYTATAATSLQDMQHDTMQQPGDKSGAKQDAMKDHSAMADDMKKDDMKKDDMKKDDMKKDEMSGKKGKKSKKDKKDKMKKHDDMKKDGDKM